MAFKFKKLYIASLTQKGQPCRPPSFLIYFDLKHYFLTLNFDSNTTIKIMPMKVGKIFPNNIF
jgi:hypothetical protein